MAPFTLTGVVPYPFVPVYVGPAYTGSELLLAGFGCVTVLRGH